jgi:predicted ATPase
MAVRVFSNNLPDRAVRAAVQEAVLAAMGEPGGDWLVQIHENQYSPSWHITIWGPNNFHWTRAFFGTEEQNPRDGYALIRGTITSVVTRNPEPKQVAKPLEPAYVESLRLKDFRCFDHLELRFDRPSSLEGRWTCIAGINGAGKSSVLQALGLVLLGYPLALELGGERLKRMRRLDDPVNRMRAEVEVVLKTKSDPMAPLRLDIDEERIVAFGVPSFSAPSPTPSWDRLRHVAIAGYGATRNLSPRVDSGNDNLSPDVRRQITLFDPLSQLAGAEVLLGRQSAGSPFVEIFQSLVRQVFGTELQIAGDFFGIRFSVADKDIVEAIDLPDGFRSAAAWIADLCAFWCEKAPDLAANANPADIQAIVLIDEIDLHLHPSLQRELVPRLRKALPKVQFIVTTHSPLVLANFDANEIIALDRDVDGNVRELDRQILGFTSDQIYEWLMGTRPMGAAMEEELRKSDNGTGKDDAEVARLMRVSPTTNEEAAGKQVAEFKEILKTLKR